MSLEQEEQRRVELPTDLAGRFKIVTTDSGHVWGASYHVSEAGSGQRYILKRLRLPPLRRELEERKARLRDAVRALQRFPHPSLMPVLEVFDLDDAIWLLYPVTPGESLEAKLERRPARRPPRVDMAAQQLAGALKELVHARQHQALSNLSPRYTVIDDVGNLCLVNHGLGLFLRPTWRVTDDDDAGLEALAIRRFGQLLFAMLTGTAWTKQAVVAEADLPDDLGPVVMRCLVQSRADRYRTLDELIRDLHLLERVVASEKAIQDAAWGAIDAVQEEPPPWEHLGVVGFVRRSGRMWFLVLEQLYRPLPLAWKFVWALALLGSVAGCIVGVFYLSSRPAPYRQQGPVVYVASGTRIEVLDSHTGRLLDALHPTVPVEGLLASPTLHRVLLSMPGSGVEAFDTRNDTPLAARLNRREPMLLADLNGASGLVASQGHLARLDLRALEIAPGGGSFKGVPVGLAYDRVRSQVVLATSEPNELKVFSPLDFTMVGQTALDTPPGAVGLAPDGTVWIVPATPGRITTFDSSNLDHRTMLDIEVKGATALTFDDQFTYIADAPAHALLVVDTGLRRLVRTIDLEGEPHVLVRVGDGALWAATTRPDRVAILDRSMEHVAQSVPCPAPPSAATFVPWELPR